MKEFELKYGKGMAKFSFEEKNIIDIIDNNLQDKTKTEEEIILNALENPIGSERLRDIVKPGEKVCIVTPDITRAWQRSYVYIPYVVDELLSGGIKEEDIIFLSATGTHRGQTEQEHRQLIGDKLYEKYKIYDHKCDDKDNLVYVGTTSYGTPVNVNRMALDCDHIVITGAIVYHFLAGWSGGRKSILPGIASYETVMANHGLSLGKKPGVGTLKSVRPGNWDGNPVHHDMVEAASLVKPSFLFNVVIGDDGKIGAAVSGHFIKAHEEGKKFVDSFDGVSIKEKADLVIGTAAGFPKDINFYQSSKLLINLREAVKSGGAIIAITECSEGLGGNDEVRDMLVNYSTMPEREEALRADYSISKHVSYLACETAQQNLLILVSELDPEIMKSTGIKVVKTIDEALKIVYNKLGHELKTYIFLHGANTFPKIEE